MLFNYFCLKLFLSDKDCSKLEDEALTELSLCLSSKWIYCDEMRTRRCEREAIWKIGDKKACNKKRESIIKMAKLIIYERRIDKCKLLT